MSDSYLKRVVTSFESRSDRVAMRIVGDDSEVYTFGEMLQKIRAVAYRLEREGVGFGDRVALIGENHPNWAIAYLGILYRGAICVPLDPEGEAGALANFIENSEAALAFIGSEVAEKFEHISEKLARRVTAVMWGPESATVPASDFRDWLATSFPDDFASQSPKAAGADVALLIYTSGTTGL